MVSGIYYLSGFLIFLLYSKIKLSIQYILYCYDWKNILIHIGSLVMLS